MTTPNKLGVNLWLNIPLEDIIPYIDWTPFSDLGTTW